MATRRPSSATLRRAVFGVLLLGLITTSYGAVWEYSTHEYLKGFSDAIVPYAATPTEKVEAILTWMRDGPRRSPGGAIARRFSLGGRNPRQALNVDDLVSDCGTAVNAFENLADVSGVPARRLLLLDTDDTAKHVVAEVFLDGRWVVVDPLFHQIFIGPSGRPLTRADLADFAVFQQAVAGIPNYDLHWSYERTAHVRLAGLPWIGPPLQTAFDRHYPQWRESLDVSRVLDRSSSAVLAGGLVLLLSAALALLRLWSTDAKAAAARHVSAPQLSFPNFASARSPGPRPGWALARLGAFDRRRTRGRTSAPGARHGQPQPPKDPPPFLRK